MQDHLESGCASCAQTLQVWAGVAEAAGLHAYGPPERGVRFVKALYNVFPPQKLRNLRLHVARLVFPVFGDLIPHGSRDDEFARRHFLFQRDNLLLDLHVEPHPESGRISMAGQIMDAVKPSMKFGDRQVVLVSEKTEVAAASTNRFGEFHLEFPPIEDLMLVIHLAAESILVTPMPSFVAAMTPLGSGVELLPDNSDATE